MERLSFGLRGVAPALLFALGGCVLISSDVTRLKIQLSEQSYTFDTSMWGNLPTGSTVAVPCGTGVGQVPDCCNPPAGLGIPMPNCATTPIVCAPSPSDATENVCTAEIPESVASVVNLSSVASNPASAVLKDVQISSITYTTSNNTLNVALPELTVYLAPQGVTDPTDSRAMRFGTIPSIPAGANESGKMELVSNSGAVFQTFAANVSTPFELIATTTVIIPSGTPIPSGHVTIAIQGTLTTQL